MNRTRVGAILPMDGGFALMRRSNVQYKNPSEYYAFPGGGVEENEHLEQATVREIEEEFGIIVEVEKLLYEIETDIRERIFLFMQICKWRVRNGNRS